MHETWTKAGDELEKLGNRMSRLEDTSARADDANEAVRKLAHKVESIQIPFAPHSVGPSPSMLKKLIGELERGDAIRPVWRE